MKLSPAQVQRVQHQFEGQVIPEGHALTLQLEQAFGEHTFFVDSEGINVVEPSPTDVEVGNVVKLASWVGEGYTTLEPNEPVPRPGEIRIGATGADAKDSG